MKFKKKSIVFPSVIGIQMRLSNPLLLCLISKTLRKQFYFVAFLNVFTKFLKKEQYTEKSKH